MRYREKVTPLLLILVFSFQGCAIPYATYDRTTDKNIDIFYGDSIDVPHSIISRISVDFGEVGMFTGKGHDQILVEMLKDRAVDVGADAILSVEVSSQIIPSERNARWTARGIAISYDE